eukprot:1306974-Prymnesium_polylepis.1
MRWVCDARYVCLRCAVEGGVGASSEGVGGGVYSARRGVRSGVKWCRRWGFSLSSSNQARGTTWARTSRRSAPSLARVRSSIFSKLVGRAPVTLAAWRTLGWEYYMGRGV